MARVDPTAKADPLRATRRFMATGIVSAAVGMGLAVAAAVTPIGASADRGNVAADQRVPQVDHTPVDASALIRQVAGSRLIRPSQVQAAVKDTGAAARLLERLKLQSVVNMGGESVAYVRVGQEGVRSVRAGGRVLDFVVESVGPGAVKLSLDGVVVTLTH